MSKNSARPEDLSSAPLKQQGALPFRIGKDGVIEVALVTSRETLRWIIPKGWSEPGESPAKAAARETFEEAGVTGRIVGEPLGVYVYGKRRPNGEVVDCEVTAHLLLVEKELKDWPERKCRKRRWISAEELTARIEEDGLAELLGAIDLTAILRNALGD